MDINLLSLMMRLMQQASIQNQQSKGVSTVNGLLADIKILATNQYLLK